MRSRSMIRAVLAAAMMIAMLPLAALTAPLSTASAGLGYQSLAAAGSDLLCGIRANDTLDCWGRSHISVADYPAGTFQGISASRRAACGLRGDQTMECWGRWYSDVDHTSVVHAPAGTFTKVDLAEEQACAVGTDGSITCFGGLDETPPQGSSPVKGSFIDVAAIHDDSGGCGIRTDGSITCWGDDTWGQATPPDGTFTGIAAGRMTVCAIHSTGELECWGRGLYGAAVPPSGRYTALAIGGDTGCAIGAEDSRLTCWGADLGAPPAIPAAAVAIGDNIAAMIGTNGVVHTWGEARLWPVWGGWDVVQPRDGFGAFRILGTVPVNVELGVPVDIRLETTPIEPQPEFRVLTGTLPVGLELSRDGHIGGTPALLGGSGPVVIVADNGKAPMASTTLELAVVPEG